MSIVGLIVLAAFGFLLSVFVAWLFQPLFDTSLAYEKLISWRKLNNGDYLLNFQCGSCFRGQCTVWRYYPEGDRAGTMQESQLADVWKRLEWEEMELQAGGAR